LASCVAAGERAASEHRWSDAVKWYSRARDLSPEDTSIAGQLAFALSGDKRYDEAVQVIRWLRERHPHIAKWPYMEGYQRYMQERWSEAVAAFDNALQLKPDYIVVLYRKGYALMRLGRSTAAVGAFEKCIDGWKHLPAGEQLRYRQRYSDACFQLGKIHLDGGWRLKARRPLIEAVKTDPDHPDKRYQLGKCMLAYGQTQEAITELEAAERLRPGIDYVLDRLGQAYLAAGALDDAERAFTLIPSRRQRPYILNHLGELLIQQGKHVEAIEVLLRVVQREYENFTAHYLLGVCYEATGNLLKARNCFREASRIRDERFGSPHAEAQAHLKVLESQVLEDGKITDMSPTGAPAIGVIKAYNHSRGFGFIQGSAGEQVFFHVSAVPKDLQPNEGTAVEYEASMSPRGLRANWLRVTERT
jgi:tetratricopeptide (TPR) repeat protein/cold shock CspA family protein